MLPTPLPVLMERFSLGHEELKDSTSGIEGNTPSIWDGALSVLELFAREIQVDKLGMLERVENGLR
jgi:hypothetical protein